MHVELVQEGRVLRTINHNGTAYVETPKKGKYTVRLRNDSPSRRLAVISVDGVNVLNGEDAGHNGPGYVLRPWETLDIPGWRRDDGHVAAFRFKKQDESYANQTGRGTQNVGVVGVAVFDEKIKAVVLPPITIEHHHHHHHDHCRCPRWPRPHFTPFWTGTTGDAPTVYGSTTATRGGGLSGTVCSVNSLGATEVAEPTRGIDVGTGYGEQMTFHTSETNFERASESPNLVLVLRYATKERLKSWGVPVEQPVPTPTGPHPFPVSRGMGVPAPQGWRG